MAAVHICVRVDIHYGIYQQLLCIHEPVECDSVLMSPQCCA